MAHHRGHSQSRGRFPRWGVFKSLLALSPVLIGIPTISIWRHYVLPKPVIEQYDPHTLKPQISEHAILQTAKHLSEGVGFRTVGTREHMLGDEWMWEQAQEVMRLCEDVKKKEPNRRLECEIWHQTGSGSHRFDIMNTRLYKTYVNLTNIIVRLSSTSSPLPPDPSHLTSSNSSSSHVIVEHELEVHPSKLHSLLVNAHLDSTLPSPGAADDALSVGVMLEIIRCLLETEGWEPEYGVIFLFNNAEESLQDGSHLFSTQHPIAPTVRAVINLEASGTSGPELLFQATSQEMIQAYAQVPRPYGTIVANDVFATGLIISDTDFRQFELYLNVTGLDMAIVGNSYFYHTRNDLVKFIEPGAAQHMADNVYAIVKYLTSDESPLGTLHHGHLRPPTFFFSTLGRVFIQYTFRTALALHLLVFMGVVLYIVLNPTARSIVGGSAVGRAVKRAQKKHSKDEKKENGEVRQGEVVPIPAATDKEIVIEYLKGIGLATAGFVGAVLSANIWAFVMGKLLSKSLSWFRAEYSCILLYGPPALIGALVPQLLFSSRMRERTLINAIMLTHSFLSVISQFLSIGSAGLTFFTSIPMLLAFLVEPLFHQSSDVTSLARERPSLVVYAIGQSTALLLGSELFCGITDVFVPLTGRMGVDAPAENIIATIVALTMSYMLPLVIPFFHRFGKGFLRDSILVCILLTGVISAVFYVRDPFDMMHPRRVVAMHVENITTNSVTLHFGALDSAPNFAELTQDIARIVAGPDAKSEPVEMGPYNNNMDVLYPLSAFAQPWKVDLPSYKSKWASPTVGDRAFVVTAENDFVDEEAGTRSLSIIIYHPGIIWTVIAFDAHVLEWSMDKNPPQEHARHYIRESSFYGTDRWQVDLVYRLPSSSPSSPTEQPSSSSHNTSTTTHGLMVNFVGIKEKSMWPGKKFDDLELGKIQGEGRDPSMIVFEKIDSFLEETTDNAAEGILLGCVGGVAVI